MEGICGVCLGRERFLRRGAVEGQEGSFLCFQPQGGWQRKGTGGVSCPRGLWDKDYLSQGCQAAEPKRCPCHRQRNCTTCWLCAALGLPLMRISLGMNSFLSMAGDSTSLSLWRIMKSLRGVPIAYTTKFNYCYSVGNQWEK